MQGQRECHRLSNLSFQVKYQRLNLGVGPSQCREVRKYSISYIISLFIHGIKAEVPSLQLCLHDRMTKVLKCATVSPVLRYRICTGMTALFMFSRYDSPISHAELIFGFQVFKILLYTCIWILNK